VGAREGPAVEATREGVASSNRPYLSTHTNAGRARLVRREQIVAVPNDRFTRDQCLNNASFCAAVDPIMKSGEWLAACY